MNVNLCLVQKYLMFLRPKNRIFFLESLLLEDFRACSVFIPQLSFSLERLKKLIISARILYQSRLWPPLVRLSHVCSESDSNVAHGWTELITKDSRCPVCFIIPPRIVTPADDPKGLKKEGSPAMPSEVNSTRWINVFSSSCSIDLIFFNVIQIF